MSKSITIRNVPVQACNELAAKAAQRGQSLQEFLRAELVALAERPDHRSLMAAIQAGKRATGTVVPAERLLAHRDVDRRYCIGELAPGLHPAGAKGRKETGQQRPEAESSSPT